MIRRDWRSAPVRRMVVMGESNAYGMNASSAENEWVQTLAGQIREVQDGPLRVFNNAIPANVISPEAPGYESGDAYATSPSALERFETDMIAYEPDLAVYAYGLNDSRCGHDLESFMSAYSTIVYTTKTKLPEALILLVGPYWNLQYDAATWSQQKYHGRFGKFNLGGHDLVLAYNAAISDLAEQTGCLFVDVYSMLEGATWLLAEDACHFLDVGQRIIGLQIFCEMAAKCSFLSYKSREAEKTLRSSIWTTGGTDAMPHVIQSWRNIDKWRQRDGTDRTG